MNDQGAPIAIGIAIGAALGAAIGNVGAGLAIGIAIGVAIGAGRRRRGPSSHAPPNTVCRGRGAVMKFQRAPRP